MLVVLAVTEADVALQHTEGIIHAVALTELSSIGVFEKTAIVYADADAERFLKLFQYGIEAFVAETDESGTPLIAILVADSRNDKTAPVQRHLVAGCQMPHPAGR